MSSLLRLFPLSFALLAAGCAVENAAPEPDDVDADESEIASPPTYACVSDVDPNAFGHDVVFRVKLTRTSAKWRVAVQEGFLFDQGTLHHHDGAWTKFTQRATAQLGEGGWFLNSSRFFMNFNEDIENPLVAGGRATIDGKQHVLTCYKPGFQKEFRYDAATGTCTNASGAVGRNVLPLEVVRETKDGECTALEGTLNDRDLGYPQLAAWNLAGADLSKAQLSFANLVDADLRGANLKTFTFGYAHVTGAVDAHTLAPVASGFSQPRCTNGSTHLDCWD